MDSILLSIKMMLGIEESDTAFDNELIMHINSAIAILIQLGVGPIEGFKITGETELWDQLLLNNINIENVRSQIYYRCRLAFDPPQNSFLVDNIKKQCDELEWRIDVATSSNAIV